MARPRRGTASARPRPLRRSRLERPTCSHKCLERRGVLYGRIGGDASDDGPSSWGAPEPSTPREIRTRTKGGNLSSAVRPSDVLGRPSMRNSRCPRSKGSEPKTTQQRSIFVVGTGPGAGTRTISDCASRRKQFDISKKGSTWFDPDIEICRGPSRPVFLGWNHLSCAIHHDLLHRIDCIESNDLIESIALNRFRESRREAIFI